MSESLPKPINRLADLADLVIDLLILGIGEKVVIAQATAAVPWLGLPVISWIFRGFVHNISESLNKSLTYRVDHVIIRYQTNVKKEEYNEAIQELNNSSSKNKEEYDKALQVAKDKMDRIINRNR